MKAVQHFETTVSDQETGLSVQFVSIPSRFISDQTLLASISGPERRDDEAIHEAVGILGLEPSAIVPTIPPSSLPYAFAAILLSDNNFQQAEYMLSSWLRDPISVEGLQRGIIPPEILLFAEYVTLAKVIPTEETPLDLGSLASVLAGGSGVSIGALAGFVAGGSTPLVLVTVPLGMIIGGTAAGVALALQEGLRQKVRKLMGVEK